MVLASYAETYGMAVTEALARGIPVLATDVGGLPEAVGRAPDGGVPGILVPPEDPAALAAELRGWFGEADVRRRLKAAARGRRAALDGWATTARSLAGVLGGCGPSPGRRHDGRRAVRDRHGHGYGQGRGVRDRHGTDGYRAEAGAGSAGSPLRVPRAGGRARRRDPRTGGRAPLRPPVAASCASPPTPPRASHELLDPLRIRLADRPGRRGTGLVVHDLGCGTGSMGRWLAPLLDGAPALDPARPRPLPAALRRRGRARGPPPTAAGSTSPHNAATSAGSPPTPWPAPVS